MTDDEVSTPVRGARLAKLREQVPLVSWESDGPPWEHGPAPDGEELWSHPFYDVEQYPPDRVAQWYLRDRYLETLGGEPNPSHFRVLRMNERSRRLVALPGWYSLSDVEDPVAWLLAEFKAAGTYRVDAYTWVTNNGRRYRKSSRSATIEVFGDELAADGSEERASSSSRVEEARAESEVLRTKASIERANLESQLGLLRAVMAERDASMKAQIELMRDSFDRQLTLLRELHEARASVAVVPRGSDSLSDRLLEKVAPVLLENALSQVSGKSKAEVAKEIVGTALEALGSAAQPLINVYAKVKAKESGVEFTREDMGYDPAPSDVGSNGAGGE